MSQARASAALVEQIRSDLFADDIDEPDWRGWHEHDLHAYFESAGATRPLPYRVPVEDPELTRVCGAHGLQECARVSLFGVSLAAAALLCRKDRRACREWLSCRGLTSDERDRMLAALDEAEVALDIPVEWPAEPLREPCAEPCVIKAQAGLCNKLRVVLAHRTIAVRERRSLIVIWRSADNCPGRFEDFFQPLQGVTFVDDDCPLEAEYNSCDCHPSVKHTPGEVQSYRELHLLPHIRKAVAANVRALGERFVAVHVRRTDHVRRSQTSMADFERFLEAHAPLPIYVATDNAGTQRQLVARFGGRVRAMKPIDAGGDAPRALRQTPLVDAVVELFTCVAAGVFKGSHASSFSDTIHHLREVNHTRDAADEHSTAPLPSQEPDPASMGLLTPDVAIRVAVELAQNQAADDGRFYDNYTEDGVPLCGGVPARTTFVDTETMEYW